MASGLAAVVAPADLTVIVNVGDDSLMYGVLVSADLDTVTYTLAGINGPHGWGIAGDTHVVMGHLETSGVDTTFRLGDRDLAHCLARTAALGAGGTLTGFTREACQRLGIRCTILPASDDSIRTKVKTPSGELLDFQDYFVLRRHEDVVAGLEFRGAAVARPAPGAVASIEAADAVVIAPSNPPLSIWPMLAMTRLREAVQAHQTVVAVSPLIGGKAVKGPLVAVMEGLGLPPSNAGIVAAYEGALTHLVIDRSDAAHTDELTQLGVTVIVADTLITQAVAAERLANAVLDRVTAPQVP
jgi:LPPG:FO 2-phospho-L-lactate transferase